ncbi:hypothetical protein [Micromonospora sp. NPDC002575]|uniref:hypothetical protein n=1 Tax=Micromonospora sp. NPDC002575 TaxID=3364222 RepID=UPI0036B38BE2
MGGLPVNAFRIELTSPPDRDFVVANIMVGGDEFAEISQEAESLKVEVYPRRDGGPWCLDYEELSHVLGLAKERLSGTRE